MNIVLNINQTYRGQACALIYSVLDHSQEDVHVYIMHIDLSEADIQNMQDSLQVFFPGRVILEPLTVSDRILQVLSNDKRWPQVVYYRLFAPFLLDVDRLLYLDSDMIADGNISELYHMDLHGKAIACALDHVVDKRAAHKEKIGLDGGHRYINSGMILYDVSTIKSRYTLEDLFSCISTSKNIYFPDQDLLNIFYRGDICVADSRYNFICISDRYDPGEVMQQPVIYHFGGEKEYKPWNAIYIGEYGMFFWKYASKFTDYFDYAAYSRHRKLNYFKGRIYHFTKTAARKAKHMLKKAG